MKLRAPAPLFGAIIAIAVIASSWAIVAPRLLSAFESAAEEGARKASAGVREALGLGLSWDSMSPRVWGTLSFSGVRVEGRGLGAEAETVSLSFDRAEAAKGRFVPTAIRLSGVELDGSLGAARAMVDAALKLFPGGGGPGRGLVVELRDSSLSLALGDGLSAAVEIGRAELELSPEGSMGFELAATAVVSDGRGRFGSRDAELELTANGVAPKGFGAGRAAKASVELSAKAGLGSLRKVSLDLGFDGSALSFASSPGQGLRSLKGSWRPGELRLAAEFARWRPESLFSPGKALVKAGPWLAAAYTGKASLVSDLSLAGTNAEISIEGTLPIGPADDRPYARLEASGSWDGVAVRRAEISSKRLRATLSGQVWPSTLSAAATADVEYDIAQGVTAAGRLDMSGSGPSWFAYAESLSAAGASLRDATLSLELEPNAVSFYADAALPGSPSAEPGPEAAPGTFFEASAGGLSRLTAEGRVGLGTDRYIEAAARFDPFTLSSCAGLVAALAGAPAAALLGPLTASGSVSVYGSGGAVSYSSSGLLLVYAGLVDGFGVATVSGGKGRFALESLDATIGGYSVRGKAAVEFGRGAGFEADIQVEDVPYSLKGSMVDGTYSVSGDYGLRFLADSRNGQTAASLEATDLPVPLFGGVSFVSLSASARLAGADDWDLVVDRVSLAQPPGGGREMPSLALSGAFDEKGGRLGRLSYSDRVSSLEGALDVTWNLRGGFRVSASGDLLGRDGEQYLLKGSLGEGGELSAELSMKRAALARLFLPPPWAKPGSPQSVPSSLASVVRGWVDADAAISGSLGDPEASFRFAMNSGQRSEGYPFAAGTGAYSGGIVELRDTRLRLGAQKVEGLALRYSIPDGGAEGSADIALALGKSLLTGKVRASGASSAPRGASPFSSYSVKAALGSAAWMGGGIDDIPVRIDMLDGSTTLSIGESGEAKAAFKPGGELTMELATGLPLSFKAAGRVSDGTISLDVDSAKVDMPFLFSFIGLPIIKAESGTARGSLKIRGKLTDPNVDGTVEFDNFMLSAPDFVSAPIGPLTEPLYFSGRGMETVQPAAPCGGATISASLKSGLHGGIPDDITLSVRTNGEGLAPVQTALLGLDIKGFAKADLTILANRDRTRIDGAISMSEGDIVLTTGVVRHKSSGSSGTDLSGNLSLSFGKGVEVYFPGKRLPVISGQADPSSGLSVAFDLARGDYRVRGQTVLRGGNVFYIQRNFYLKSATIEFDEDQDQFDPKISAEAETRSQTDSGSVTVTLRAIDARLSNLSFALSSVPAMSEADIVSLLGRNLIGEESGSELDPWRLVVENYDLIPELDVVSIFERNLKAALGLDLLVVSTKALQRLLYDISGSATPMTLADYVKDSSVMAGKYIGEKLFLQGALELVDDPLASGSGLRLDSTISLEWKAPHFTLQWSLQPENIDSLFIEDQKFTFLWRVPLK